MRLLRQTRNYPLFLLLALFVISCADSTKENPAQETEPPAQQNEPVQNAPNQSQVDVKEATRKELEAMGIKEPEKASRSEVDYTAVAKSYCDCSTKSKELDDQMQSLASNGDSKKFEELSAKVTKEFGNSIKCARTAKEKATTKALDKSILVKEMKAICPDLPAKLVLDLITKV